MRAWEPSHPPAPLSAGHLGTWGPLPPSAPICCDSLRPRRFLLSAWGHLHSAHCPRPRKSQPASTSLPPCRCGLMVPACRVAVRRQWRKLRASATSTGLSLLPSLPSRGEHEVTNSQPQPSLAADCPWPFLLTSRSEMVTSGIEVHREEELPPGRGRVPQEASGRYRPGAAKG